MRITIKATKLELTPAVSAYIEQKIGLLVKFIQDLDKEGAVECRIEIARITKHHNKGPVYKAEANLRLPGKLLRAEHIDWNIRRCVDEIKDELQCQIKKYKALTNRR
ncbi:ribosomal subunit interface protein [Candidatus Wolfebacteria bacterium RIFCSPLOWO2_01_FULL_45_19]|uniref:Ribosomal subunit interface protein n=1 Tax=Candidatus Wolfebacteria bacterium RIFCSPLOWO2_01_FULL_45_19 TaxID=1802557 RepID=A0A1F8DSU3_9BACT|nr:MAG: Ribosome-associated inhibitor protein Y [Parcubacteria group bacterium GW2011_GWB1_45_9]OGM91664.1 MAG: ribosomal subunit interface protein [Candidatus Wolfebacteria bacterium RIFCSPLOWO2_01_FULL_45_19]